MNIAIKRLETGDEAVLEYLAVNDADFDIEGRGSPREPLSETDAHSYLANPSVLFWISLDEKIVTGFLSCVVVPLRSGMGQEVLLYEIGVHHSYQRLGIGRALVEHMEVWMRKNGVSEVWVGADNPGAVAFYEACGFEASLSDNFIPVYMAKELSSPKAVK